MVVRKRWRRRLEGWARPRGPEALPVRFDRRRVYVLPTAFGLFFGALLLAMGIGALNYNNNPALLLCLLLAGTDRRDLIAQTLPLLGADDVVALRQAVSRIHASEALIDYVQALVTRSRQHPGVRVGLSPRAGIALLRAARAYALQLGRAHVLPEDVQALFGPVATHRLVPEADAGHHPAALAKAILHAVPVD